MDRYTPGRGALPPPPTPLQPHADERQLVAAILRNDRKAAARFVAAHIDAVYAYVHHRLTPHVDATDDVVQDVFVAALDGLAAFQGQSSLRGWLIGIARHKVEDLYRRRLRAPEPLEDLERDDEERLAAAPAMEDRIHSDRERAKARQVLADMPERYAVVLRWRYWEQRSVREIADAIGATEKSVERTLARARERFREHWVKEERHD